jgi:hypothetical protein
MRGTVPPPPVVVQHEQTGAASSRQLLGSCRWCCSSELAALLDHPLIIQTIRRDLSGSVGIDEAPNLSRADPSGADQIDAEHQATNLAVGFESPAAHRS